MIEAKEGILCFSTAMISAMSIRDSQTLVKRKPEKKNLLVT